LQGPAFFIDSPFEYTHDFWEPVATKGWQMDGYYQTVTNAAGESTLKFEGALVGPEKLENK